MKIATRNQLCYLAEIIFGILVCGWGITQVFLFPSPTDLNLAASACVGIGVFILFIAWFSRLWDAQ